MTTEQENTYEKVVDIKSKKPFKQSNKLCDEHQADWVAEEVCKVINKAMKKKFLFMFFGVLFIVPFAYSTPYAISEYFVEMKKLEIQSQKNK